MGYSVPSRLPLTGWQSVGRGRGKSQPDVLEYNIELRTKLDCGKYRPCAHIPYPVFPVRPVGRSRNDSQPDVLEYNIELRTMLDCGGTDSAFAFRSLFFLFVPGPFTCRLATA